MERVNPATGEALDPVVGDDEAELDPVVGDDEADVEQALARADETFEEWRAVSLRERRQLIAEAADILRERKQEFAELMTREMGKPISQAVAEIEKCARVCEYYAEHAADQLADDVRPSPPHADAKVCYEPLGPVLAVMPWNFPFWQVFRFAAPGLTAGNVGLLKHASNVPGCALAIEEVFQEAGYPDGVFQSLLVGSDDIDGVVEDDRVAAATLTGSEGAGRAVAETAGRELMKTVLELGGSDPFVVLADADVEAAAETAAWGRLQNSGQSCIAAKRFVVHDDVYDEFIDRFVGELEDYTVGDPMDEDTQVGPQARADLVADLHDQVKRTVEAGATVELGGEPLEREGFYYPPTVLTDVPRDAAAACEEVFGPVAAVFRVESVTEAVAVANDTHLGLGGAVFTNDLDRGEHVAHELEAGCIFVNEYVKSDPRLPFGGVADSGYGRELDDHGIREFVNRKTVWVQSADHAGR